MLRPYLIKGWLIVVCIGMWMPIIASDVSSGKQMPIAFTKNMGQWDERVLFRASAGGATMWFTKEGVTYQFIRRIEKNDPDPLSVLDSQLPGKDMEPDSIEQLVITAKFVGANPNPEIVGEGLLKYKCNYFIGNDPTKWYADVPNYDGFTLKSVYPGIDVRFSGDGNGQAAYEFVVASGSDLAQIKVAYDGAEESSIDADGRMIVNTKWGDMIAAIKSPINGDLSGSGSFSQISAKTIGFEGDGGERQGLGTRAVGLSYSTYLGGTSADYGYGIAVDLAGSAYVTGYTYSSDFPTASPFDGSFNGGTHDAFVTKLSPAGNSLVYSTYLGGTNYDYGGGIAVDSAGSAYVTGATWSSNFPTANPFDGSFNGGTGDAFVTKLSPAGNSLVYSTYLGGTNNREQGLGIAVDSAGSAYVAGQTFSSNFPTTNPFDGSFNGGTGDAFVTKLSPAGNSLIYSSYLGGTNSDCGFAIAIDLAGSAYVTGLTQSSDFPTANPFDGSLSGAYDAFVTKLSPAGNSLVYSTYLGGDNDDYDVGIAVDLAGSAYVTGATWSSDFPTASPFDGGFNGGTHDAFVTKLSPAGNSLVYSTYLGGDNDDDGEGIAVDLAGSAYVNGMTESSDFLTASPFDGSFNGGTYDAFVTKLSPAGNSVVYSTYLGGTNSDYGEAIAIDLAGSAYVTGSTNSSNFPTQNPYQTYHGSDDVFVTKLDEGVQDIVPVVLVHGWDSGSEIWQEMHDWLEQDGHPYVWSVSLEKCGTGDEVGFIDHPERMYRGNAKILADFIEGQIQSLPADVRIRISLVDIIAHSMGGLVARRYICTTPGDLWAPRSVRNLIMLGTPNNGSGLANGWPFSEWLCPSGPAWQELQPKYMKQFNANFPDASGTNYYASWGSAGVISVPPLFLLKNYACNYGLGEWLHYPNDGTVAKSSVTGQLKDGSFRYPDNYGRFLCHSELHSDQDLYNEVIQPILLGSPPKLRPLERDTISGVEAQYCFETAGSLSEGSDEDGSFYVESGAELTMHMFASDPGARFTLLSPSGQVFDSSSTSSDSSVVAIVSPMGISGFVIRNAEFGNWQWQVRVGSTISPQVHFSILATCENSIVVQARQSHDYVPMNDTLNLQVEVANGGVGVLGLDVEAIAIWNDNDTAGIIAFQDNGSSGDEQPSDGIYGIRLANLMPGVAEFKISVTGSTPNGVILRLATLNAYVLPGGCGDCDYSGQVDISDAVYVINYIFADGPVPQDSAFGDFNCNNRTDITDAVYLINYIFAGGAAPCAACP